MRPVRVGSACWKVQVALEEAMAEGGVLLPPELSEHVSHCARCKPEVEDLQYVLARLRAGAASIGLSQVPAAVDRVISQVSARAMAPTPFEMSQAHDPPPVGVDARWLFGQLAGIAAAFLMLIFGLGWLGLKVSEMSTGASPGEVVANVFAPFKDWVTALVRNIR